MVFMVISSAFIGISECAYRSGYLRLKVRQRDNEVNMTEETGVWTGANDAISPQIRKNRGRLIDVLLQRLADEITKVPSHFGG